ncbi:hypothetical protein BOX15_Mlig003817g2, partial [Macrostomum lignano]
SQIYTPTMPVYMRKRQDSPSLSQLSEPNPDIDADFVLDPDKHRDPLPQPYRLIDKLIETLLERSFQEIFSREEEREHEQARHKPPQVPTDLCRIVPNIRSAIKFLCPSADEPDLQQEPVDQYGSRYVFCACEGGQLFALDGVSMATVGSFEAAGLDLAYMATAQLKPGLHLLATIDELGLARLFLWDGSAFHLARLMNEDEGDKRINCLAACLSVDGEYLALTMQNASTKAVTLEFHRVPRDAWAKEVEQQAGKPNPQAGGGVGAAGAIKEDGIGDVATNGAEGDASGPTASEEAGRVPVLKLSPLAPVLRVRQPQPVASTAGATAPNLKLIDSSGEVVGSGAAHLLTQPHLQLREANFRRERPEELKYLLDSDKNQAASMALPTVQFLKPGRTQGTEQTMDKNVCVSAAVAWSGDYKVFIYPLLKVGKDLEFRPETVWTFGSPVTCLTVSHCASLIAVGLESGNLILHDLRLGLVRHVISVDPENPRPIVRVFFLNPPADEEQSDNLGEAIYKSTQPVRAAIYNSDLKPYLADIGPEAAPPTASPLPHSARHAYEAPQLVDYYPLGHPTLLLRATRSGAIVLHDVRLGREVLHFNLPPPYQLPEPWQPGGWALAAGGRSLFIRGRRELTGGEGDVDATGAAIDGDVTAAADEAAVSARNDEERLFCYSLKILVPMRPYWKQRRVQQVPCFVHCKVEQRADAYLQHRNATHTERQKTLVDMWSNLFNTLKEVEAAAAAAAAAETPRSVKTLRTSFSSMSDDSKDARLKEFLKRADNATSVA